MFSKVLDSATGLVDSTFALVALFPVLAWLAGASLLLDHLGNSTISRIDAQWNVWSGSEQLLVAIAAGAAVFVVSHALYASVTGLIRLFEGYFGPARWLDALGLPMGRARAGRSDLRLRHPDSPAHQLPTRLGNCLRAAEVYPTRAYGLDSVLLWERLFEVLPDNLRKSIGAARSTLDFLVVVSSLAVLYGIFGAILVAAEGGGRTLWLVIFVSSLSVAWLAYASAVETAAEYGNLIRSAYDHHRFDLLVSLHLPLPNGVLEERRLWNDVNSLVRSGEPSEWWVYTHPKSKE